MDHKGFKAIDSLRKTRIIYPIIVGCGFILYMLYKEFDPSIFSNISFGWNSIFWLVIAVLLMVMRDVGYVIRLKILSDGEISWLKSIKVVFLWEFASAITPSAIGGTSVAIIFVHKAGLNIGKSAAVVMATSLLDELYFIIFFPLLFIFVSPHLLFDVEKYSSNILLNSFYWFAIVGYSIKLIWVFLLGYGLFVNPVGLRKTILFVFKLPFLRRWKKNAYDAGADIIFSSRALRRKPFKFWLKSFFATAVSWTSRYWVVNTLFLAFFIVHDHFIIFARQLVMWIMMLLSPTPGGSGFAEFIFKEFLFDFINTDPQNMLSYAVGLAFLWRLISYYPYLIIGAIIFPRWLRDNFNKSTK
ncbi:MAG: flippase-like domain-containing protein [Bacteroidales bacterium]|nr:flippase-like domain-containing protein [Bacteroidales bacterium]